MVPTRLTLGFFTASIILFLYSIFFYSGIAMIVVIAIALLAVWRLFIYHGRITGILSRIQCHRDVSATLVRQGIPLRVTLRIAISLPPDFSACVRDEIPGGMVVTNSKPEIRISGASARDLTVVYTVTPLLHGSHVFPGIIITLQDRFFSDTFHLAIKQFSGPEIRVYPAGNYEPVLGLSEYGEQEIEQFRALSGFEIRGFRDFIHGDDTKSIDWKLTAKFDKYIVREYTGRAGSEFLLVADLPDSDDGDPGENFLDMIRALAGEIDQAMQRDHRVSLVFISGPNVIRTTQYEDNLDEVMRTVQNTANPVKRLRTYYRYRTTREIRGLVRDLSRETAVIKNRSDEGIYLNNLAKISNSIAETHGSLAFQGEIARILRMMPYKEITIFSVCSGDMSHIRFLIDEIHKVRGFAHLKVPGRMAQQTSLQQYLAWGTDSVQVF
jgi:uncharacterized protein (DUF58 family)